MSSEIASRIMPRTTIDLDGSVLRELKARQAREHKTLGQLASELLAQALSAQPLESAHTFEWVAQDMAARVDIADKEVVNRILDER